MGFVILILGVALWAGAHLFKRLAPGPRGKLGNAGKGLVALALVASIVLMVIGYRAAPFINVWMPPAWTVHINNLLMLIALWLMSPAPKRGKLVAGMRHPMLTGFKLWAVAHLLVNGDLSSILLFGGLLAWSVAAVITINRADRAWVKPQTNGSYVMDAAFLAASVVLLGIIGFIHNWLGVWPFPS